MRLALAGLPFQVGPDALLHERERADLDALSGARGSSPAPTFDLSLVAAPPWDTAEGPELPPLGSPARVDGAGGRVRVSHEGFLAELTPGTHSGRLFRRQADSGGLRACLRVALRARLPLEGGLPLHAAGVKIGDRGAVFFGPSGAGKTTLASLCPWPVLSEELVAAIGEPFKLWGVDSRKDPLRPTPLGALFELAKGPETVLEPLDASTALRRLLNVVLVPPDTEAWGVALGVVGRLAATVPVFRLTWSPSRPPWAAIGMIFQRLAADGPGHGSS